MSCILSQHFVGSITCATIVPSFRYFQTSLERQLSVFHVLCMILVQLDVTIIFCMQSIIVVCNWSYEDVALFCMLYATPVLWYTQQLKLYAILSQCTVSYQTVWEIWSHLRMIIFWALWDSWCMDCNYNLVCSLYSGFIVTGPRNFFYMCVNTYAKRWCNVTWELCRNHYFECSFDCTFMMSSQLLFEVIRLMTNVIKPLHLLLVSKS